jgi:SAM-dependent methyltransferase
LFNIFNFVILACPESFLAYRRIPDKRELHPNVSTIGTEFTMNFCSTYASTYDALYKEKNYEAECDFLEEIFHHYSRQPIKRVLDLGCGTGSHALPLVQRGFTVHGVDRSAEMISIAKQKSQSQGLNDHIQLETADIRNVTLHTTFDAVICMFAVLGYQISNDDLFAALQTARRHLKPKGLFICDFWYGPAVLGQRPAERIKTIHEGEDRIIRIARPEIDIQKNVVTISYHLLRLRGVQLIEETQEVHQMRYLFQPEIEFMMKQAGLDLLHFCPFMKPEETANEETWNVTAIAQAK